MLKTINTLLEEFEGLKIRTRSILGVPGREALNKWDLSEILHLLTVETMISFDREQARELVDDAESELRKELEHAEEAQGLLEEWRQVEQFCQLIGALLPATQSAQTD